MRSILLGLRATVVVVLIPGAVTVYLPYRILRSSHPIGVPRLSVAAVAGGPVALIGVAVLLACVWHFAVAGRGTLAPFDPPRQLVVVGLYRFTRNPMYNGVVTTLAGESLLFRSMGLAWFALSALVVFHLVVVLYEEPALKAKFGESYARYRRAVPRWGFTVHPPPSPSSDPSES
jgi:protein-S-isoprenylcysteine O-methyltransferase Ste14